MTTNVNTQIPANMPPDTAQLYQVGLLGLLSEQGIIAVWDWVESELKAERTVTLDSSFPPRPPILAPDGVWWAETTKGGRTMNLDPDRFGEWSAGSEDKGKNLKRGWTYDEERGGFHRWDGKRWENYANTRTARNYLWSAVSHPHEKRPHFKVLMDRQKVSVLDAVQRGIARKLPLVVEGAVPIANGVFDLATGEVRRHNPDTDTHRDIIPQSYRADWTDEHCLGLVRGWFTPSGTAQIDDANLNLLLDVFGMILSGRAQMHKPLIFLYAQSGGGKGATQRLIDTTLDSMVAPMSALSSLFGGTGSPQHDATVAKLLLNQQLVLMGSEIRGAMRDRLLQLTGDEKVSARFPGQFGAMVEGYPICAVIISTTEPPELPSDRGAARRLVVIKFNDDAGLEDEDKRRPTGDECAAFLTIGLRRAMLVTKPGYKAPQTLPDVDAEFMAQSDPLREYIRNLYTDGLLRGLSLREVADGFNSDITDDRRKVSTKRVGTVIKAKTTALPNPWTTTEKRGSVDGKQQANHYAHPASQPPTPAELDTWLRRTVTGQVLGAGRVSLI